jgi:hypothetical protein
MMNNNWLIIGFVVGIALLSAIMGFGMLTRRVQKDSPIAGRLLWWIPFLAGLGAALYGAYWLYSNPNNPIANNVIWLIVGMMISLAAWRLLLIILYVIRNHKPMDTPNTKP